MRPRASAAQARTCQSPSSQKVQQIRGRSRGFELPEGADGVSPDRRRGIVQGVKKQRLAFQTELLESVHHQIDDLLVLEAKHVDQDVGQMDILLADDILDLALELGDRLGAHDPFGVLHGLQEVIDDAIVSQLPDGRHGCPTDVENGGTEDLGLDQLLYRLDPAQSPEGDHGCVLDDGIGVVELVHEEGIDIRLFGVAQVHDRRPDGGNVMTFAEGRGEGIHPFGASGLHGHTLSIYPLQSPSTLKDMTW